MWQFTIYFKDGKVMKYTVIWFPIELNWIHTEYHFLPNTYPDSKYYLEKYF